MYPAVPPFAFTFALPVDAPLHKAGVAVAAAVRRVGSETVAVVCIVHPFASVTVTVYVPAERLEAVATVPPEGDHEYV